MPAAGRRDRVSLALWPPGPEPASPEFVEVDGRVVALVVVWPTDARGMLTEASDLDRARVLRWVVSDEALARLAEEHRTWHLARHEVWVFGDAISPCPRSLFYIAAAIDLIDRRPGSSDPCPSCSGCSRASWRSEENQGSGSGTTEQTGRL